MGDSERRLLVEGLRGFGIEADPAALAGIELHLEMVREWSERINLTAIKEPREMILKHAVDSAAICTVAQLGAGVRLLDVGTGAGFPGVSLKCLFPETDVVLLESLQKRCRFLAAVQSAVAPIAGFSGGLQVVWGRAEEVGQDRRYREQFDLVVARAVAELRVLVEYGLPFCRVGGHFIAMKGPGTADEVSAAEYAVSTLGGVIAEVKSISLPHGAGERSLIRIVKSRATPKGFPRKAGTPSRTPI